MTCSKNASSISKTSQNELINFCDHYIKGILAKMIKETVALILAVES